MPDFNLSYRNVVLFNSISTTEEVSFTTKHKTAQLHGFDGVFFLLLLHLACCQGMSFYTQTKWLLIFVTYSQLSGYIIWITTIFFLFFPLLLLFFCFKMSFHLICHWKINMESLSFGTNLRRNRYILCALLDLKERRTIYGKLQNHFVLLISSMNKRFQDCRNCRQSKLIE